jgi:hypothetical protein
VLITSGTVEPMPPLPDVAFLYDPATGSVTRTGDLIWNQAVPVATLLTDGRVLIVEGRDPACETTNKPIPCGGTELYDPASGTFSPTGEVRGSPWRARPASVLLPSGKVLVAGGEGGNEFLKTADLYEPSAAAFTATSDMTLSRDDGLTGTLLLDGTVLIAGGGSTNIGITATAELYDPAMGIFHRTANMSTPRTNHAATLLTDGSVLISGGYFGGRIASAELYRPAVLTPPPMLLSLSGDGKGQGAIQHASTYQLVTPDNPAVAGEILAIYFTGLLDGCVIPPQVAVAGRMAEVLWFGNTPGYPGLNQINVLPGGVAPGPAVSVRMNYIGRPSNEVTIAMQ